MSNLTWQEVYKLPLKLDEYSGSYVWSSNGTMALHFKNVSKEDRVKIVASINGYLNLKIEGLTNKWCDFFINGELAFYVRGWGHLTGTGALNLSEKEALEIQNGFIEHIVKSLTL